jgi:hypothetical protein
MHVGRPAPELNLVGSMVRVRVRVAPGGLLVPAE